MCGCCTWFGAHYLLGLSQPRNEFLNNHFVFQVLALFLNLCLLLLRQRYLHSILSCMHLLSSFDDSLHKNEIWNTFILNTVLRIDKPFPLNILLDSFHPYQGGRSLRYFQQLLSWHFFLSLVPMSILLELTSLYSELVAEWPFCFIMGWKNDIHL